MSRETLRGCLVQGGIAGLAVLAMYGLVSNMSWENYEANKRLREQEDSQPYRPPNSPEQTNSSQQSGNDSSFTSQPQEQVNDNCAAYPDGVSHRDDVCVNGQCGATFFGRRGPGIETTWEVEWYDTEGRKHELTCDEVSRDAVIPDPNH